MIEGRREQHPFWRHLVGPDDQVIRVAVVVVVVAVALAAEHGDGAASVVRVAECSLPSAGRIVAVVCDCATDL